MATVKDFKELVLFCKEQGVLEAQMGEISFTLVAEQVFFPDEEEEETSPFEPDEELSDEDILFAAVG